MVRLPTPGGDNGNWGNLLNDFLSASHNGDGTLQTNALQQAGGLTQSVGDGRYVQHAALVHDVKSFGAKGDGTTDDTAAIQLAINTAGTQGSVYLPPGTYIVSAALSIPYMHFTLTGSGYRSSKIVLKANSNTSVITTPDDGVQRYGLLLRDFAIDGQAASQSGTAPTILIRAVNEARLEGLYILNPRGDAIYIGQATGGMYNTVPMLHRLIIRGDSTHSQSNGINLNTGSSDAQVVSCDIGFFSNGAGVLLTSHNGFNLSGCQAWQNRYGYQIFDSHRGRMIGCLSDYARLHGFVLQNSNDTQFIGCQARESSRLTPDTADGFYLEGTSASDIVYNTMFSGCRAVGTTQRYGLNLNQHIYEVTIAASNFIGNTSGGVRTGAPGVVSVAQYDHAPQVTDADGNLLFGYTAAGVPIYSQFSGSATVGSNGAPPAQVQGYLVVQISGGTYKVPYYNA